MFCGKCGKLNVDGAAFCAACGNPLTTPASGGKVSSVQSFNTSSAPVTGYSEVPNPGYVPTPGYAETPIPSVAPAPGYAEAPNPGYVSAPGYATESTPGASPVPGFTEAPATGYSPVPGYVTAPGNTEPAIPGFSPASGYSENPSVGVPGSLFGSASSAPEKKSKIKELFETVMKDKKKLIILSSAAGVILILLIVLIVCVASCSSGGPEGSVGSLIDSCLEGDFDSYVSVMPKYYQTYLDRNRSVYDKEKDEFDFKYKTLEAYIDDFEYEILETDKLSNKETAELEDAINRDRDRLEDSSLERADIGEAYYVTVRIEVDAKLLGDMGGSEEVFTVYEDDGDYYVYDYASIF